MRTIPINELSSYMGELADTLEMMPLSRPLGECVGVVNHAVEQNFMQSGSPIGPWPPRKDNLPHPLLILSGDMMAAATQQGAGHIQQVEDREAVTGIDGNSVIYALAQNFGYPPRNLPARTYMVIADEVADRCSVIVADHAYGVMEAA